MMNSEKNRACSYKRHSQIPETSPAIPTYESFSIGTRRMCLNPRRVLEEHSSSTDNETHLQSKPVAFQRSRSVDQSPRSTRFDKVKYCRDEGIDAPPNPHLSRHKRNICDARGKCQNYELYNSSDLPKAVNDSLVPEIKYRNMVGRQGLSDADSLNSLDLQPGCPRGQMDDYLCRIPVSHEGDVNVVKYTGNTMVTPFAEHRYDTNEIQPVVEVSTPPRGISPRKKQGAASWIIQNNEKQPKICRGWTQTESAEDDNTWNVPTTRRPVKRLRESRGTETDKASFLQDEVFPEDGSGLHMRSFLESCGDDSEKYASYIHESLCKRRHDRNPNAVNQVTATQPKRMCLDDHSNVNDRTRSLNVDDRSSRDQILENVRHLLAQLNKYDKQKTFTDVSIGTENVESSSKPSPKRVLEFDTTKSRHEKRRTLAEDIPENNNRLERYNSPQAYMYKDIRLDSDNPSSLDRQEIPGYLCKRTDQGQGMPACYPRSAPLRDVEPLQRSRQQRLAGQPVPQDEVKRPKDVEQSVNTSTQTRIPCRQPRNPKSQTSVTLSDESLHRPPMTVTRWDGKGHQKVQTAAGRNRWAYEVYSDTRLDSIDNGMETINNYESYITPRKLDEYSAVYRDIPGNVVGCRDSYLPYKNRADISNLCALRRQPDNNNFNPQTAMDLMKESARRGAQENPNYSVNYDTSRKSNKLYTEDGYVITGTRDEIRRHIMSKNPQLRPGFEIPHDRFWPAGSEVMDSIDSSVRSIPHGNKTQNRYSGEQEDSDIKVQNISRQRKSSKSRLKQKAKQKHKQKLKEKHLTDKEMHSNNKDIHPIDMIKLPADGEKHPSEALKGVSDCGNSMTQIIFDKLHSFALPRKTNVLKIASCMKDSMQNVLDKAGKVSECSNNVKPTNKGETRQVLGRMMSFNNIFNSDNLDEDYDYDISSEVSYQNYKQARSEHESESDENEFDYTVEVYETLRKFAMSYTRDQAEKASDTAPADTDSPDTQQGNVQTKLPIQETKPSLESESSTTISKTITEREKWTNGDELVETITTKKFEYKDKTETENLPQHEEIVEKKPAKEYEYSDKTETENRTQREQKVETRPAKAKEHEYSDKTERENRTQHEQIVEKKPAKEYENIDKTERETRTQREEKVETRPAKEYEYRDKTDRENRTQHEQIIEKKPAKEYEYRGKTEREKRTQREEKVETRPVKEYEYRDKTEKEIRTQQEQKVETRPAKVKENEYRHKTERENKAQREQIVEKKPAKEYEYREKTEKEIRTQREQKVESRPAKEYSNKTERENRTQYEQKVETRPAKQYEYSNKIDGDNRIQREQRMEKKQTKEYEIRDKTDNEIRKEIGERAEQKPTREYECRRKSAETPSSKPEYDRMIKNGDGGEKKATRDDVYRQAGSETYKVRTEEERKIRTGDENEKKTRMTNEYKQRVSEPPDSKIKPLRDGKKEEEFQQKANKESKTEQGLSEQPKGKGTKEQESKDDESFEHVPFTKDIKRSNEDGIYKKGQDNLKQGKGDNEYFSVERPKSHLSDKPEHESSRSKYSNEGKYVTTTEKDKASPAPPTTDQKVKEPQTIYKKTISASPTKIRFKKVSPKEYVTKYGGVIKQKTQSNAKTSSHTKKDNVSPGGVKENFVSSQKQEQQSSANTYRKQEQQSKADMYRKQEQENDAKYYSNKTRDQVSREGAKGDSVSSGQSPEPQITQKGPPREPADWLEARSKNRPHEHSSKMVVSPEVIEEPVLKRPEQAKDVFFLEPVPRNKKESSKEWLRKPASQGAKRTYSLSPSPEGHNLKSPIKENKKSKPSNRSSGRADGTHAISAGKSPVPEGSFPYQPRSGQSDFLDDDSSRVNEKTKPTFVRPPIKSPGVGHSQSGKREFVPNMYDAGSRDRETVTSPPKSTNQKTDPTVGQTFIPSHKSDQLLDKSQRSTVEPSTKSSIDTTKSSDDALRSISASQLNSSIIRLYEEINKLRLQLETTSSDDSTMLRLTPPLHQMVKSMSPDKTDLYPFKSSESLDKPGKAKKSSSFHSIRKVKPKKATKKQSDPKVSARSSTSVNTPNISSPAGKKSKDLNVSKKAKDICKQGSVEDRAVKYTSGEMSVEEKVKEFLTSAASIGESLNIQQESGKSQTKVLLQQKSPWRPRSQTPSQATTVASEYPLDQQSYSHTPSRSSLSSRYFAKGVTNCMFQKSCQDGSDRAEYFVKTLPGCNCSGTLLEAPSGEEYFQKITPLPCEDLLPNMLTWASASDDDGSYWSNEIVDDAFIPRQSYNSITTFSDTGTAPQMAYATSSTHLADSELIFTSISSPGVRPSQVDLCSGVVDAVSSVVSLSAYDNTENRLSDSSSISPRSCRLETPVLSYNNNMQPSVSECSFTSNKFSDRSCSFTSSKFCDKSGKVKMESSLSYGNLGPSLLHHSTGSLRHDESLDKKSMNYKTGTSPVLKKEKSSKSRPSEHKRESDMDNRNYVNPYTGIRAPETKQSSRPTSPYNSVFRSHYIPTSLNQRIHDGQSPPDLVLTSNRSKSCHHQNVKSLPQGTTSLIDSTIYKHMNRERETSGFVLPAPVPFSWKYSGDKLSHACPPSRQQPPRSSAHLKMKERPSTPSKSGTVQDAISKTMPRIEEDGKPDTRWETERCIGCPHRQSYIDKRHHIPSRHHYGNKSEHIIKDGMTCARASASAMNERSPYQGKEALYGGHNFSRVECQAPDFISYHQMPADERMSHGYCKSQAEVETSLETDKIVRHYSDDIGTRASKPAVSGTVMAVMKSLRPELKITNLTHKVQSETKRNFQFGRKKNGRGKSPEVAKQPSPERVKSPESENYRPFGDSAALYKELLDEHNGKCEPEIEDQDHFTSIYETIQHQMRPCYIRHCGFRRKRKEEASGDQQEQGSLGTQIQETIPPESVCRQSEDKDENNSTFIPSDNSSHSDLGRGSPFDMQFSTSDSPPQISHFFQVGSDHSEHYDKLHVSNAASHGVFFEGIAVDDNDDDDNGGNGEIFTKYLEKTGFYNKKRNGSTIDNGGKQAPITYVERKRNSWRAEKGGKHRILEGNDSPTSVKSGKKCDVYKVKLQDELENDCGDAGEYGDDENYEDFWEKRNDENNYKNDRNFPKRVSYIGDSDYLYGGVDVVPATNYCPSSRDITGPGSRTGLDPRNITAITGPLRDLTGPGPRDITGPLRDLTEPGSRDITGPGSRDITVPESDKCYDEEYEEDDDYKDEHVEIQDRFEFSNLDNDQNCASSAASSSDQSDRCMSDDEEVFRTDSRHEQYERLEESNEESSDEDGSDVKEEDDDRSSGSAESSDIAQDDVDDKNDNDNADDDSVGGRSDDNSNEESNSDSESDGDDDGD